LEQAAYVEHLDLIAITDHDEIEGALLASRLARTYGIQVVQGEEISTRDGHLLAYFIHERIPPHLSLIDTVMKVREQGGLCAAAHPMAFGVHALSALTLYHALQIPEVHETLVGIEALNAGLVWDGSNQSSQALCATLKLAATAGSDSHERATVGDAATAFAGTTPADLRRALIAGSTDIVRRKQPMRSSLILGFVFRRTLRQFGWVTWNPEPRAGFAMRRLAQVQTRVNQ
jgi:predicted metal-dependent phosphoesterase TrpH